MCFIENEIIFGFPSAPLLSRESELVGIIASQVELEQLERDQMRGDRDTQRVNPMGVIEEGGGEDEQQEEHEEDDGGVMSDDEWTRGPIQLQYDDASDPEVATAEQYPAVRAVTNDSEPGDNSDDADENSAADKSPLRLRGGVGLPRSKAIRSAQPTAQGALSERRNTSSLPPAATGEHGGSSDAGDIPPAQTMDQRPSPPPSHGGAAQNSGVQAAKRQTPLLRAPSRLRRSTSITGGSFKPPRPAGGCRQISGAVDESAPLLIAIPGDHPQQPPTRDEPQRGLSEMSEADEAAEGNSDGEDSSDREERSQVVVPGWGSQGHHPVEYSEGQLSFIPTSQLRTSRSLVGGRSGSAVADNEPENASGLSSKRQKVLGEDGRSYSSGSMDNPGHGDTTSLGDDRGGAAAGSTTKAPRKSAVGRETKLALSDTPSFEEDYEFDFGSTQQDKKSAATLVAAAHTAAAAEGAGKGHSSVQPTEEERRCDEEDTHQENKTGERTEDVQSRWAGADARLRLAQARGMPSPSLRKQRNDTSGARRESEPANALSLAPGGGENVSGSPNVRHRHPSSLLSPPTGPCDTAAKLRGTSETSLSTVESRLGTMKGQVDTVGKASDTLLRSSASVVAGTTITSKSSPCATSGIRSPAGVQKPRRPSPRLRSISIAKVAATGKKTAASGIANAPAVRQSIGSLSPGGPQHGSAGDVGQGNGDGARSKSIASRNDPPATDFASVRQENARNGSVASPDLLDVRAATLTTEVPAKAKVARQNVSPNSPIGIERQRRFQRVGDNNRQRNDVDLAAAPPTTPGGAASPPAASLASPTSFSPAGLDWGHSPALPLSGHSDHSDMIPLGQRSPALPITTSPVSGSTADVCKGRGAEKGRAMLSGEPSSRNRKVPLTPGNGATGSPDGGERVFSGFTPPTPRPRAVRGRSEVVVLRPRENAPDPRACAATLARLGVPQVGGWRRFGFVALGCAFFFSTRVYGRLG